MKTVHFVLFLSLPILALTMGLRIPGSYPDPIYYLDGEKNTSYLSFNVRWQREPVRQIAGFLREHNIQASFFMSEEWALKNEDIVAKLLTDGHDIGLRPNQKTLLYDSEFKFSEMLKSFTGQLEQQHSYTPALFRPPQGEYHGEMLFTAKKEGYKTILWGINLQETAIEDKSAIICHLLQKNYPGSIILLQTSPQTVAILPHLLNYFAATRQRIDLLSEALKKR